MSITAMKQALEALENPWKAKPEGIADAIIALRQAIEQAEKPKYRRGDRLVCLETEEFCVIHISGTDRQWVKFPDTQVCVFTNQQVDELFELLPKEIEQAELVQRAEEAFERSEQYVMENAQGELERISLVQTGAGIGKQAEQAQPAAVYRAGQAPGEVYHVQFFKEMNADEVLLYTAPLQRQPLTDEEIAEIAEKPQAFVVSYAHSFARAIEKAHNIK